MDTINKFQGETKWLSNFELCEVHYDGDKYTSTEAAFQAAKCLDKKDRIKFFSMSPIEARKAGRNVALRSDWEYIKDNVMYEICKYKFTHNEPLKQKLISTKNKILIEGNAWGDVYWGVCKGKGKNKLGKILMKIRDELSDNS